VKILSSELPSNLDTYRKTVLPNGVRVISEANDHMRSVSIGIWVRAGSRYEPPHLNGICHFIEHMLFKGTPTRDAYAIAKEIDSVGGVLNAFTSKEFTAFYAKALKEDLQLAVDLLTDIFLRSTFPEDEIPREKHVICQEICQLEDNPEELVHEIWGMNFWRAHALGRPILGTISNILAIDRDTLLSYKREHYLPSEIIVAAAGSLDHNRLLDMIAEKMGDMPRVGRSIVSDQPAGTASAHVEQKDLEQVHLCLGTNAPSAVASNRYAAYILNTLLGGGMSSRLFQEVREKRGLAYSVYSFLSSLSDSGMLGIYAGCDPERLEELVQTIGRVTRGIADTLTQEEMDMAKNQIKGSLILSLESSDAQMNRIAKEEFYFGRHITLEEILDALQSVTLTELSRECDAMINQGEFTIVALGPVKSDVNLQQLFESD